MWFSPNLTYPPMVSFLTLYPLEFTSVQSLLPISVKKERGKQVFLHSFYDSLLSKKEKKKKKRKNKIKIWYQFLTIHKHEEHKLIKLVQIKSSNTIKVQTTDLSKYNPKTQVKTQTSAHPHTSKPTDLLVTMPQIPFFKP